MPIQFTPIVSFVTENETRHLVVTLEMEYSNPVLDVCFASQLLLPLETRGKFSCESKLPLHTIGRLEVKELSGTIWHFGPLCIDSFDCRLTRDAPDCPLHWTFTYSFRNIGNEMVSSGYTRHPVPEEKAEEITLDGLRALLGGGTDGNSVKFTSEGGIRAEPSSN